MRAIYIGPATRLGLERAVRLPRTGRIRIDAFGSGKDGARADDERDPLIDALLDALEWLDR